MGMQSKYQLAKDRQLTSFREDSYKQNQRQRLHQDQNGQVLHRILIVGSVTLFKASHVIFVG